MGGCHLVSVVVAICLSVWQDTSDSDDDQLAGRDDEEDEEEEMERRRQRKQRSGLADKRG